MVDNSSLPVASGNETFANDDIGGVKYPRQKSTWGPDGTANDTDVASGKALPVQLRSATGLIPGGEPTDAAATATDTTSVSWTSLFKQISKSVQALVTGRNGLFNTGTSNSGLIASLLSLQTTELNALANGALIVSSVGGSSGKFTNADTGAAKFGEIHFTLGTVTTMSAGANLSGWFLQSNDSGSTYESLTVVPPRPPDFIVPLDATTGNKIYKAAGQVRLPALQFKVLVQNNSGQSFTATGNTLKLAPIAELI
jgi:hypothetical protein